MVYRIHDVFFFRGQSSDLNDFFNVFTTCSADCRPWFCFKSCEGPLRLVCDPCAQNIIVTFVNFWHLVAFTWRVASNPALRHSRRNIEIVIHAWRLVINISNDRKSDRQGHLVYFVHFLYRWMKCLLYELELLNSIKIYYQWNYMLTSLRETMYWIIE